MHKLLQQVTLLLTSKKESITDSAMCCANVTGKAQVQPKIHADGRQPASIQAMGPTSGA